MVSRKRSVGYAGAWRYGWVIVGIISLAAAISLPSSAEAQASLPVKVGPPAGKFESRPPAPGDVEDYAWQPGYWRWLGGGWVWSAGQWLLRPARGIYWQPGAWQRRPYGYVWSPGFWVDARFPDEPQRRLEPSTIDVAPAGR